MFNMMILRRLISREIPPLEGLDEPKQLEAPPLGITVDEARQIRKLEKGVPSFCQ